MLSTLMLQSNRCYEFNWRMGGLCECSVEKEGIMAKRGWSWKKWNGVGSCLAVVCAIILFLVGCRGGSGSEWNTMGMDGSTESASGAEVTPEDLKEEVIQRIKEIDPSRQEAPIDTAQYDFQMEEIYKGAFWEAVTNQIPIYWGEDGKAFYYKDLLLQTEESNQEELLGYIRQSDFYYQDVDGDGLPELTVNTEGPCVLKYDALKKRVELYVQKGQGWNPLGNGQMYYYSYTQAGDVITIIDRYESIVKDGGIWEVQFKNVMVYEGAGWNNTYMVSVDGSGEITMERDSFFELKKKFLQERTLHPMSFDKLFGEDGQGGYVAGDEPWPRYLLEDLEALPMNEETGEEWEVYQRMLEGDYSLVEGEEWMSLQNSYESSLESGNGTCNWSYFLMDFNQDGRKELYLRFRENDVNNTASFHYENGQVKMWGSYQSGDSHGYDIPLVNGKLMSVSWYQDDITRWIKRLDAQCSPIRERCYDVTNGVYSYQDYYRDGQICASSGLSDEEWKQIEDMLEELSIPEDAWKSCSVFTPSSQRPEVPGVG